MLDSDICHILTYDIDEPQKQNQWSQSGRECQMLCGSTYKVPWLFSLVESVMAAAKGSGRTEEQLFSGYGSTL